MGAGGTPLGGLDWVATQLAIQQWVVAGSGLLSTQVVWGQQGDVPRLPQPAIVMHIALAGYGGLDWRLYEPNLQTFDLTVTTVSTSACTLTIPSHGLATGTGPIQVTSTGALPSPLVPATSYWVIVIDANTIQVASTYANAINGLPNAPMPIPVMLTSTGSGSVTLVSTPDTVPSGAELLEFAQGPRRADLTLECYTSTGVGLSNAVATLNRVHARRAWSSQKAILQGANVGVAGIGNVRAVPGIQGVVLLEPRAIMSIRLNLASSEATTIGRIDTVTGAGTVNPAGPGTSDTIVIDVSDAGS